MKWREVSFFFTLVSYLLEFQLIGIRLSFLASFDELEANAEANAE